MVSNISLNTTVVNQNRTQTTNNKNNNVVSIHQEKNKTNEYLNKEQKFTLKQATAETAVRRFIQRSILPTAVPTVEMVDTAEI